MHSISRDELQVRQRPEDRRPGAETGDGQSHRKTTLIRKPLGHHRNGRRISETVPHPDNYAKTHKQVVQTVCVRGQEEAQADQEPARQRHPERAELVLQPPGKDKRNREHENGNREHSGSVGPLPAEFLFQRGHKHTPGIQRAQRQVHAQAADHTPPAINTRT
jgi:hypothetical protein